MINFKTQNNLIAHPGTSQMDNVALNIVYDYVVENFKDLADQLETDVNSHLYSVWKCKTLQNWKYLIGTSLHDGLYFEVTYNGDKEEWYLDVYSHAVNQCIPMSRYLNEFEEGDDN